MPTVAEGGEVTYSAYQLQYEVDINDSTALKTATFVNGDFYWQEKEGQVPSMIRVCPMTQFLNKDTHLCEPCAANSGTSQLLQASCVSCGTMWWYETTTLESTAKSIEYATANKLCQNPEAEYEKEKQAELAKLLAEQEEQARVTE